MDDVDLVCVYFPELEQEIRLLYSCEDVFRQVCDDYLAAVKAQQYWQDKKGEQTREYSDQYTRLVSDLKLEILQLLAERQSAEK